MSSEWQTSTLVEIASNISRPFKFNDKETVIFINTGDVLDGGFLHREKISKKGLPGQAKKAIEPGDILYSEIRPGNKRHLLVNEESVDSFVVSTKFMVIKAIGPVSPEYLYLILTGQECEAEFKIIADSRSGTFPQVTFDSISYYPIRYPKPDTQQRIVEFSAALTNKIQLNKNINQTLEQMAQAIFKSWFVDFEPVKAKIAALEAGGSEDDALLAAMQAIAGSALFATDAADADAPTQLARLQTEHPEQYTTLRATAELFPSTMQESELGEIPEGWEPVRLEHYIELAYGKALKKTDRVEGPYRVYGSGGITGTHNDFLVQGPSIILGRKGTIGSIYWENQNFYPIDTTYYVIVKNGCTLSFAYYLLQTLGLKGMNTDAAVPGLNRNNVYRLETPCYPKAIIDRFTEMAASNFSKIANCNAENLSLVELRDTLLPKLLSGELSVSAATDQITQAEEAIDV